MPPSADDKLIEEAVQDFSKGLHSDLPLRHFGEFHEQGELKKVVELHKENVLKNKVIEKVWTRDKEEIFLLLEKINDRINKEVIVEWGSRNGEHEVRSVSFLQKWVDMLCDNFNVALEYQLLLNPDMDLESLKKYVEGRKQIAMNVFESIWKPGNSRMQDERKSKLEKQLQSLEEDVFEKYKRNLESKAVGEGSKLLGEVRSILLERSRQLKSYVDKHRRRGRVSNHILRGMVEEMRDYLLGGKGSTLRESHEENLNKLVEFIQAEIKFLTDIAKAKMTAEHFSSYIHVIGYAEKFDEKIRSCCCDNASNKVQEMGQDMNTRDPGPGLTADPRRYKTMRNILSEFKEEQGGSLDLEQNQAESLNGESDFDGSNDNDGNNNGGMEPGSSKRENVRMRQHSFRHRLKRFVKDTYVDDPVKISGAAGVQVSPSPSKKPRAGPDVARKTNRRAHIKIHRRSSRLKNAFASNSISAQRTYAARQVCQNDDKKCPNRITILKGDSPKYLCLVCNSQFRWKKYLKCHGEFCGKRRSKSFICDECGKGFLWKKHLDAHIRTHTGRKPFQCPKCPQRFSDKWTLAKHIRCHAKASPYICTSCNMKFVSPQALHAHNLTHEGKVPFSCSYCGKRYSHKYQLRNHVIIHADEHPFECTECGVFFTEQENLSSHFEHAHRHSRKMAQKLSYDASVTYLVKETKNESCRDIPAHKINGAVVNHVIKKANLLLPPDISAA